MLKTVKNGSGIRVDPPPPVFSKFPHFPVFFGGGASLIVTTFKNLNHSRESFQSYPAHLSLDGGS